ncbi:MAG: restriction endonuclease [Candidatus Gracilibacteria bacterium]|nr:restriction endonuclease [Candidatus Gracilibacteria bacterium]
MKSSGYSYQDTQIIASFIDRLKPDGFEQYVTDFFKQPKYGFSAYRIGGMNDKGIDVKAIRRNEDGTETYLIVQCKKWEALDIHKSHVAEFYGDVADIRHKHDCKLIFISTIRMTQPAKDFCDEHIIDYVDCNELLKFNAEYPLQDWIKQMRYYSDSDKYLNPWKPFKNEKKQQYQSEFNGLREYHRASGKNEPVVPQSDDRYMIIRTKISNYLNITLVKEVVLIF